METATTAANKRDQTLHETRTIIVVNPWRNEEEDIRGEGGISDASEKTSPFSALNPGLARKNAFSLNLKVFKGKFVARRDR
jgi:hypothetical protein